MKINNKFRITLISILSLCILFIAYLVFTPSFPFHVNVQSGPQPTFIMIGKAQVCYIPFQEITNIGFWLNVIMTMPIGGFLLLLNTHKIKFRWVLVTGLLTGLFIESLQFILDNTLNGFMRFVDINDVISNTLGVIIGFYALQLFLLIIIKIFK
ncbi:VanZ family protein [Apilactobacillus timberlakei]|uniref:VanZ family protein n=1 Tax=Apilactobacillus timberlakei TaxID=2008380 RepID=UPI00112CDE77|nr:VanZ family protein [Apilactobacillus timberlakei]TPR14809.1 VanZ family protein [Apilactobacillus timberlakei]